MKYRGKEGEKEADVKPEIKIYKGKVDRSNSLAVEVKPGRFYDVNSPEITLAR